jgi:hypothetical protein
MHYEGSEEVRRIDAQATSIAVRAIAREPTCPRSELVWQVAPGAEPIP